MMKAEVPVPTVLGWRADAAGEASGLQALWSRVGELGWLRPNPADHPLVVLQIGERGRSPLVIRTARRLVEFLREGWPALAIDVLDPVAQADEWDGLRLRSGGDAVTLSGIAASRGLAVPSLWFTPFYLITVAAVGPEPVTRLAGVLDAQADPLRRLRNPYAPSTLIYEAHRLAASDLSVACGHARWNHGDTERWWAVGTDDVAVDQVVASAAGIDPMQLPMLQSLARHELVATHVELQGSLPRLHGYVVPAWKARIRAARLRVTGSHRAVAHDLALVRRNLRKIPGYVRRQLGTRRGSQQ